MEEKDPSIEGFLSPLESRLRRDLNAHRPIAAEGRARIKPKAVVIAQEQSPYFTFIRDKDSNQRWNSTAQRPVSFKRPQMQPHPFLRTSLKKFLARIDGFRK